jgi:serine/threonine-protein kinase HipA
MVEILNLLKGSNQPAQDQKIFIKAQILFWLIGATDGHAKNFSIYLGPAGRFYLTPLYDILTAQPSVDARQLLRKQMKLAISVGNKSHYVIDYIQGRHFIQTVERAGLPRSIASDPLDEIAKDAERAFQIVASRVQGDAARIHESVHRGFMSRLPNVSS